MSIAIVVFGFQFFISSPSASPSLAPSGGSFISAEALANQVKGESRPIYRLGPMEGYSYSLDSSHKGVDVISYLPLMGPRTLGEPQPKLVVETYQDAFTYRNSHLEPLNLNNVRIETPTGITVQFNEVSLDFAIVTPQGKQAFAVIRYASWQFPTTLMNTANQLKLVESTDE